MTVTMDITMDIQKRVATIENEMATVHKERAHIIHAMWVAAVSQQHLLMVGPGGTGKSFLVRDFIGHILDAKGFEIALDETTSPDQVLGPPNIKAMVEDGKTCRVLDNMLAEAHYAFIDEFFNANGPVLHSLMPIMNERVIHNNGQPTQTLLRAAFMGTNKLNADADQAATWDRIHQRIPVRYVQDRTNQADMVSQAIARLSVLGRGTQTTLGAQTTVTLAEMDIAFAEAMQLEVDDTGMALFLDIKEELFAKGIEISDRRMVEGMAASLANAWVCGNDKVLPANFDILQNMWWTLLEHAPVARSIILSATNPGEKAALDLLENLEKVKAEVRGAEGLDEERKRRVGVEAVKNVDRLLREVAPLREKAIAAGASTQRLDECVTRAAAFKNEIAQDIFGLSPATLAAAGK